MEAMLAYDGAVLLEDVVIPLGMGTCWRKSCLTPLPFELTVSQPWSLFLVEDGAVSQVDMSAWRVGFVVAFLSFSLLLDVLLNAPRFSIGLTVV
eukprot:scaffold37838_cov263-Skeletonema_marinoi.AAC.3